MQGSSPQLRSGSREAFTVCSRPVWTARGWPRSSSRRRSSRQQRDPASRRSPTRPTRPQGADPAERPSLSRVGRRGARRAQGRRQPAVDSKRDLSDTLEGYAVEAVIAQAEAGPRRPGRGRAVPLRTDRRCRPRPATALADTRHRPTTRRPRRVAARGEGRPRDPRAGPPGRRRPAGTALRRAVASYLETASTRREQQTATVISALPLGDDERARLAAGLAASTAARSTSTPSSTPGSWAGSRSRSVTRSSTAPSSASSTRHAAPWVPEARTPQL